MKQLVIFLIYVGIGCLIGAILFLPDKKQDVPQKPFYITGKDCKVFGVLYCRYNYVDAKGKDFVMDDSDDKYNVGDSIK